MSLVIDSALKSSLLPEEQILWTGTPDLVYRKWRNFRRDVFNIIKFILIFVSVLHIVSVLDHPIEFLFDLRGTVQLALVLAFLPAVYIFLVAIQQRRADKALRTQPAKVIFVLTNRRILAHYPLFLTTISRSLAKIDIHLKSFSQGYGTIVFYTNPDDDDTPIQEAPAFLGCDFFDIANASEVYNLITKAQKEMQR